MLLAKHGWMDDTLVRWSVHRSVSLESEFSGSLLSDPRAEKLVTARLK